MKSSVEFISDRSNVLKNERAAVKSSFQMTRSVVPSPPVLSQEIPGDRKLRVLLPGFVAVVAAAVLRVA